MVTNLMLRLPHVWAKHHVLATLEGTKEVIACLSEHPIERWESHSTCEPEIEWREKLPNGRPGKQVFFERDTNEEQVYFSMRRNCERPQPIWFCYLAKSMHGWPGEPGHWID